MTLEEKYILARWCYAVGEPFISDMEYRYVEDEVRKVNPDNAYLTRSWSDDPCPVQLLKENGLGHLVRGVEFQHKSESIRSIFDEGSYRIQFAMLDEPTFVSYKIDGWNTQVNYYNGQVISANTRGRSGNFMKADVIMKIVPQTIPILGKVKVTGEASIPKSKWREYAAVTGNTSQRNSMSTVMANGDAEYASFKAFNIQTDQQEIKGDRYDLLTQLGFETPMRIKCNNFVTLDRAIKILAKREAGYDYLTDGVVVENGHGQIAVRIYCWQETSLQSYVTGYIENRGSYGDSMVVAVKPVKRDGITRKKVSVTNIRYIVENNLRPGSPIAFDIRSAADAVLNTTRTQELQKAYAGQFDLYRDMVDAQEG